MLESPRQVVLESLASLLEGSEKISQSFHQRLFETQTELVPRFAKDAKQRDENFTRGFRRVANHLEQGSTDWDASVPGSKDAFLALCAGSRRDGDLHHIPDSAHIPVGQAFLAAVEEHLTDPSPELLEGWAEVYAEFSNAQRIIAASKIHRGFDPAKAPAEPELILTCELDEDLDLVSLLNALSLSNQYLKLSFQDEVERPSGHLLLKSGQVLEADCRDEGGQPAFRMLMMHPHQRVRVQWVKAPEGQIKAAGELAALLSQCEPQRVAKGLIDASQLAANGAAPEMSSPELDDSEDEEIGIPTPVMVPVALESLAPMGPDDTQPMPVAQEEGAGFTPADLSLTRIVRRWVPKLQEIPHLRALILLEKPKASEGKFWSRDGAQISVSDLGKFAQATVWAQAQLPQLSGGQDPVGYSSTTEHRLGCIVTDVDSQGIVRVCLFDPATPLGKVRHTVKALIALSSSSQSASN